MLYEADLRERPITEVLDVHRARPSPPSAFAVELAAGVAEHRVELDEVIAARAEGWSLKRMPIVDRNLLRLATFELLHRPDVPPAVAIDEAVELAKQLSTDDSPRFINGVLGAIAAAHPRVQSPEGGAPQPR